MEISSQTNYSESENEEYILNQKIRNEIFSREILNCGVKKDDSILHLGSGFRNSSLFDYIFQLKSRSLVPDLDVKYTAVDVNSSKNEIISTANSELEHPLNVLTHTDSAQNYLDNNTLEYDWTIVSGLFDTIQYEDDQFNFIDKILGESLKYSKEGLIISIDSEKQNDKNYIQDILTMIDESTPRYKISRLNEFDYIICIYKYFHSIIPQ
jgi:hypothetical protein